MRIIMMGTGAFAVPTFRALLASEHQVSALVTRPPHGVRAKRRPPPNPMREVAERRGVPVIMPERINAEQSVERLIRLEADLFVVCDFGQILSPSALAASRLGGINLHGSLLPKYRGAAPVNWAVYHGERQTGVTIIHMTPRLDAGPCLGQACTAIGPDETAEQLEPRLAELGTRQIHEAIELLERWDGTSPLGMPQNADCATKAPRLAKSDGQVDWSRSAEQIRNQVRALKPWPGTFTTWQHGKKAMRLILDRVSVAAPEGTPAAPGKVVSTEDGRLLIGTGDGLLSLDRIQPAGKRAMRAEEFLRGHRVGPGEILCGTVGTPA